MDAFTYKHSLDNATDEEIICKINTRTASGAKIVIIELNEKNWLSNESMEQTIRIVRGIDGNENDDKINQLLYDLNLLIGGTAFKQEIFINRLKHLRVYKTVRFW